ERQRTQEHQAWPHRGHRIKKDQPTGKLTRGIVKDILTNSATHPHGIKVRLQDGQVGRVKVIHPGKSD
ncbi:LOW QUALITY PROTEIN: hypothetical protein POTG_03987, partial [Paenibacillus sp. oral taxon 786 str. D14]